MAATLSEVSELSEGEARAQFRYLRFVKTGGEPECPKCKSRAIYEYKNQKDLKCAACNHRFTLTSGTAFAYSKKPFKVIMQIVAQFNMATQGTSARQMRKELRKHIANYKTVWVWVQKVRAALKEKQQSTWLSGEVEIDGAEFGGYIRPKNTKKTPSDHRKFPYRAEDRKMMVTLARQRDGQSRAWVCKEEKHAIVPFKACLVPGTHVFADKGHWTPIREHFPLHQLSHRETYYTPEACTNFAESGFNVFRTLERIVKSVASTYLDLYAAQVVWQLDRIKMTEDESFASIMGAMFDQKRSPMAGYFRKRRDGGAKRLCDIVDENGEPAFWRPPTPEERRQRRNKCAGEQVGEPSATLATLRRARSKNWRDDFQFMPASEIMGNPTVLPTDPGVYALFFASGERLLERSGYFPDPHREMWSRDRRAHLYTGETYSLRTRLAEHLSGSIKTSNVRERLLALQFAVGGLSDDVAISESREETEASLTRFIAQDVIVGFKACGYVREAERLILTQVASPLNIADRATAPYSRLLVSLGQRFREAVTSNWNPEPTIVMPRRRR